MDFAKKIKIKNITKENQLFGSERKSAVQIKSTVDKYSIIAGQKIIMDRDRLKRNSNFITILDNKSKINNQLNFCSPIEIQQTICNNMKKEKSCPIYKNTEAIEICNSIATKHVKDAELPVNNISNELDKSTKNCSVNKSQTPMAGLLSQDNTCQKNQHNLRANNVYVLKSNQPLQLFENESCSASLIKCEQNEIHIPNSRRNVKCNVKRALDTSNLYGIYNGNTKTLSILNLNGLKYDLQAADYDSNIKHTVCLWKNHYFKSQSDTNSSTNNTFNLNFKNVTESKIKSNNFSCSQKVIKLASKNSKYSKITFKNNENVSKTTSKEQVNYNLIEKYLPEISSQRLVDDKLEVYYETAYEKYKYWKSKLLKVLPNIQESCIFCKCNKFKLVLENVLQTINNMVKSCNRELSIIVHAACKDLYHISFVFKDTGIILCCLYTHSQGLMQLQKADLQAKFDIYYVLQPNESKCV